MVKKILCVCVGNSDRSPLMVAFLQMLLHNTDHAVVCESAGVSASEGGSASEFAIAAAKRVGQDISGHRQRHINTVDLTSFDLVICVSDVVAGEINKMGVDLKKIHNAEISGNGWPFHFEQDFEPMATDVLSAMYQVVARYFP